MQEPSITEQILETFPDLPHLRMAVMALYLAANERSLPSELEAWARAHPLVKESMGSARTFLQTLCPIRYPHTNMAHKWEEVAAAFPAAACALKEAQRSRETFVVSLDPQAHTLRSRKPGKRALAAAELAAKSLWFLLDEDSDVSAQIATPSALECNLYIGVLTQLGAAPVFGIEYVNTCSGAHFAATLASELERAEVSLTVDDNGCPIKSISLDYEFPEGVDAIFITVPVVASEDGSGAFAERLAKLGAALQAAIRTTYLEP